LVLGLPFKKESEGYDRTNMRLPEDQYQLFDAIYHVNQNIVLDFAYAVLRWNCLSLTKSKPLWWPIFLAKRAARPSMIFLLGKANPSGHFAESWPYHYTDVPSYEFYPGMGMFRFIKRASSLATATT
jgi:beta-glucosidase